MLERVPTVLGRALKRARPGTDKLAVHASELRATPGVLDVSSRAFAHGCPIPARYTADGEKLSPPLSWSGVPLETRALVLLIEDADSPSLAPLVHAIVWDLPPRDGSLPEGALPTTPHASVGPAFGRNSYLQTAYLPPDPPPGHGEHRYAFQLFALDCELRFERPPGRRAVREAMLGHVLAKGSLLGTYQRA